eukprot:6442815-Pyramimonas_sp.AAC.1
MPMSVFGASLSGRPTARRGARYPRAGPRALDLGPRICKRAWFVQGCGEPPSARAGPLHHCDRAAQVLPEPLHGDRLTPQGPRSGLLLGCARAVRLWSSRGPPMRPRGVAL